MKLINSREGPQSQTLVLKWLINLVKDFFKFFSSGEKTLVLKMEITIDAAKIKDFYKGYYEQLHGNKFENLGNEQILKNCF